MKRYLIVIDMQRDFVDGALGTAEAEAIVPAVVRKIRSHEGEVWATMDTHREDYLQTAEGRKLPVPHCIRGTAGWEPEPRVAEALREKGGRIIEKPSFGSTELPRRIAEDAEGEEFELELIGLCTDICVVSNALLLKACFPEAPLRVDARCCAGVTPQLHEAALRVMESCQVEVEGGRD